MIWDWVLLVVGMVLLIKGADFFVDGASGIAKKFGIPSLIIGLTLVSLGTSAPEISVSLNAVLEGMSDMSVGNVVGSNICNIFLILGVSAIFTPLLISKDIKRYDIPIMLGIFILFTIFSFLITPGAINWYEGIILLVIVVLYTLFLIKRTKASDELDLEEENTDKKVNLVKCIIFVVLGLAAIIFGGELVVNHASNIAIKLGMSETLVSLTIVAVGTSLPELVTSAVAAFKKEGDIAVGNVIGSCLFNIILILGLASVVAPLGPDSVLSVQPNIIFDVVVMIFGGISLLAISFLSKKITRWQGILFLAVYVAYIAFIIVRN